MIGIGVDLVEVDRFRLALSRTPGLVDRLFTENEKIYSLSRPDPAERFAVRFAAKEAVMKALGVGLGACSFKDIEVDNDETGAPSLRLYDRAAELAFDQGITSWKVTLTHTQHMAEAIAIAL